MPSPRGTEILKQAFEKNFPQSGLQVRLVDESGLPFTEINPLPVDTEINLDVGSVVISNDGGDFQLHAQTSFSGNVTRIAAGNSDRAGVLINVSGNDVFVGSGNNVLITTGYLVEDGDKVTIPTFSAIWGITAGSAATVFTIEVV